MQQPNDITLRDVINHIAAADQSLSAKIESAEKSLHMKIEENAAKINHLHQDIAELQRRVKDLHGDCYLFFGDIAQLVTVEMPHAKSRLDRLEENASLKPLPAPVLVE